MQLKIKNTAKGQRGVYVDGELVLIDAGATSTFTGASAAERDAAAAFPDLRVQSSEDGKTWTDHFKEEMPEQRPWLVIARDADGTDMKVIDLGDRWMVGMTVASERPEGPQGYTFVKVGGDMSALPEQASGDAEARNEAEKPKNATPVDAEPVEDDGERASDSVPFDAAKLVSGNATDVIKAIGMSDADMLSAIKSAEEAREGGPRKGVMKAIEERETDPFGE